MAALLLACGGGSGGSSSASGPTQEQQWTSYAIQNSHTIASIEASNTNYSDLTFLAGTLQGRTIVGLGESGHGVAQFDSAKVRLVKYLHENQGFDVLAFESSMFSAYLGQEEMGTQTATQVMKDSIFGVWFTPDVVDLFQYIQGTQATDHPLIVAGLDVQFSTAAEKLARPATFKELVAKFDPVYAQQVFDLDSSVCAAFRDPSTLSTFLSEDLKASYATLTAFLDAHMAELQAAYPDRPLYPLVARQAAWGMGPLIDESMAAPTSLAKAGDARDAGMAANLDVLLNNLYPGKKVLVWMHNNHLMHNESAASGEGFSFTNFGSLIYNNYRPSLYVLGLFMYSGSAAEDDRTLYAIPPAPEESLEGVLHTVGTPYVFMDLAGATQSSGNSWMFSTFGAREWGTVNLELVPRDQFDGVLLVNTVTPPDYVQ